MLGISLIAGHTTWAQEPVVQSRFNLSKHVAKRDASTLMSGGDNNEGEAHGSINPPKGSTFTDIPVGNGGETIAAYWTKNPNEDKAKQAFIFIHGKLRDGDNYWTIMNDALDSAVKANYPGADEDSIVVAPEFFSTKYNSGVRRSVAHSMHELNCEAHAALYAAILQVGSGMARRERLAGRRPGEPPIGNQTDLVRCLGCPCGRILQLDKVPEDE